MTYTATATAQPEGLVRYLRKPAVRAATGGWSDATIWRKEQAGLFPKRITLGPRSVAWVEEEVIEWQRARNANRDTEKCPQPPEKRKAEKTEAREATAEKRAAEEEEADIQPLEAA